MLPPRPSLLEHSHPCLSPTYARSMFEGRFKLLRPSVRGTPSTTIHSEGLLLRVGTSPCASTYNCGLVQHVVLIVSGLHNHTNAAQKPQRAMQTVLCKRPLTASNNMNRGRNNCCTTHVAKAKDMFSGLRLHLPRRATLERVPTD